MTITTKQQAWHCRREPLLLCCSVLLLCLQRHLLPVLVASKMMRHGWRLSSRMSSGTSLLMMPFIRKNGLLTGGATQAIQLIGADCRIAVESWYGGSSGRASTGVTMTPLKGLVTWRLGVASHGTGGYPKDKSRLFVRSTKSPQTPQGLFGVGLLRAKVHSTGTRPRRVSGRSMARKV